MEKVSFGETKEGIETHLFVIKNEKIECHVTDYGTSLVSLWVSDKTGTPTDIVLGYDHVQGYEEDTASIGCNIGRNANRIAGASFTLEGKRYRIEKNDGENNLHSGSDSYSKRIWKVESYCENRIVFSLESPDMDQGFPGNVQLYVSYEIRDDTLKIIYKGRPDKKTIINMTNHSYFNLNGQGNGNILKHKVAINADRFTPSDESSIPIGIFSAVKNTPMDFIVPKEIGRDIDRDYEQLNFAKGYDHNYCVNGYDGHLQKAVKVWGDISKISMEISTDYPGVQMYTANYLENIQGKDGNVYNPRQAVCFEPQFYPDAVNKQGFISPVCDAGKMFHKEIVYRFKNDC